MEESIINIQQFCAVCLNEEILNEHICITNCSHIFCRTCLDNWFNQGKGSCPICRTPIQYFKNEDNNYRVVIHTNANRNTHLISRREVERIIRQNYSQKYFIFFLSIIILIFYGYYLSLNEEYNHLLVLYNNNIHNITILNEQLIHCSQEEKSMYINICDNIGHIMKKCIIPYSYYMNCFYH